MLGKVIFLFLNVFCLFYLNVYELFFVDYKFVFVGWEDVDVCMFGNGMLVLYVFLS